ncbi:MAG: hypothetical protein PVJ51_06345 [Acidobacteriota bacterium]
MSLRGLLSDIHTFLLRTPATPTLIEFASGEEREEYSRRILQRLGLDVSEYSVLNIHHIGIDVPVRYVFEEILAWDGDSRCWPNHLARVSRVDGALEHIEILLLGHRRVGLGAGFLRFDLVPLFRLDAMRIVSRPDPENFDNARYLLYRCSGGYPIGLFGIYVRSPIADRGEHERAQLTFAVGFDFYGHKELSRARIINSLWEAIHDRATGNILNEFKKLCENRFRRATEKIPSGEGANR